MHIENYWSDEWICARCWHIGVVDRMGKFNYSLARTFSLQGESRTTFNIFWILSHATQHNLNWLLTLVMLNIHVVLVSGKFHLNMLRRRRVWEDVNALKARFLELLSSHHRHVLSSAFALEFFLTLSLSLLHFTMIFASIPAAISQGRQLMCPEKIFNLDEFGKFWILLWKMDGMVHKTKSTHSKKNLLDISWSNDEKTICWVSQGCRSCTQKMIWERLMIKLKLTSSYCCYKVQLFFPPSNLCRIDLRNISCLNSYPASIKKTTHSSIVIVAVSIDTAEGWNEIFGIFSVRLKWQTLNWDIRIIETFPFKTIMWLE